MAKARASEPVMVRIPMPTNGIDRGQAVRDQPPGTCYDALNVCAFGIGDRRRIGKDSGNIKAVQTLAGSTLSNKRITGLAMLSRARGAPSSSGGSLLAVNDSFSTPAVATTGDIGDDYNVFEWSNSLYSVLQVFSQVVGNGFTVAAATGLGTRLAAAQRFLNAVGQAPPVGAQIAFATDNDVEATFEATAHTCTAPGVSAWGAAGEAWGCGPFILGNINCSRFITAVLRKTAANTFRLAIYNFAESLAAATSIAESADIAIAAGGPSLFTIRLRATAGQVVATLTWSAVAAVGTGVTVTASTPANVVGNTRAGFGTFTFGFTGSAGMAVATTNSYRLINRVRFTKLVPPEPIVYISAQGSTPSTANNFYVPGNLTSVCRDTNAPTTIASAVGFYSNTVAQDAGGRNIPTVDDTDNRIEGAISTAVGGGTFGALVETAARIERAGVDYIPVPELANTDLPSPRGGAAFRVADDLSAMIYLQVQPAISGAGSWSQNTGCFRLGSIVERRITSSALNVGTTVLDNGVVNDQRVIRENSRIRFTDDGTTIRVSVNGIVVASYTPDPTWQATAATGGTSILTKTKCGVAVPGYGSAATPRFGAILEGRITEGELPSTLNAAETDPKVLVVTQGQLDVADIAAGTLTQTSGSNALLGAMPVAASFNSEFYVVDGTNAGGVIVNPITNTNRRWSATAGTAPWDDPTLGPVRCCATYRGRVCVARASSVSSFVALPRVAVPTDFDYGSATSPSTKAYASNAGNVGQPTDAVTALIPYSDDYMIIGCANSIFVMEGDPGFGGAIQAISYRTGMLGPRSYCFDERGNVYFMGSAGLYFMPKGSRDPELISGRKLASRLDRVNVENTLIQLVYDAFKARVHVFLTPGDGTTVGTHVWYGTRDQDWWESQYPIDHGPWSVCDLVGPSDEDRRFLIGGNDGYIRRPSDSATSHDGTAMTCRVRLGPFSMADESVESMAHELAFIGASGSSPINWYWLTGDSAEEVMTQTIGQARTGGTVLTVSDPGFNTPIGLRQSGGAHALELRQSSSTATFAIESILFRLSPTGRRRI